MQDSRAEHRSQASVNMALPGHFYLISLVTLLAAVLTWFIWSAPVLPRSIWLGGGWVFGVVFYFGALRYPDLYWRTLERWYHELGSPRYFYRLSGLWLPWLVAIAVVLCLTGLVWGLAFAPPHHEQGNSYRIIYLHVPASSAALMGYMAMGVAGLVALVWRLKMAEIMIKAIAPFGAVMAAVSLISGAIWGRPTWGTYWIWDARLTSMLILLFLYLGVIALQNAIRDPRQAGRAASLLSVVGVINVVIVRYSVDWWQSLHQGSSMSMFGTAGSAIHPSMLAPLLLSMFGIYFLYAVTVLVRARTEILWRERKSQWVREEVS
ncbi:heme ABC transporter permease CcmC [Alcanivorax limicola]|uniref:heme ABC transporter permease CcmC n=1 Tax=Alcanivorax limicola TaxID=2874102 RepID=UPI0037C00679